MPLGNEKNISDLLLLAEELIFANKVKEAINTYKLILDEDPENYFALVSISAELQNLYLNYDAEKYVIKAYQLYNTIDDMVAVNYSFNLIDDENYTKTIEILEKEKQNNSTNFLVYNNLGFTYFLIKEYENAYLNYNISIQLEEENPLAYCNRGYLRYFVLNDKEGIDDLVKAHNLGDIEAGLYLLKTSQNIIFLS